MKLTTSQERFWAGKFGKSYIKRNNLEELIIARMIHFSKFLQSTAGIFSILELGCNIGLNLSALKRLNPKFLLTGIEINSVAANKANNLKVGKIINNTVTTKITLKKKYDLTFTSGVLIHINPIKLKNVYENLFYFSRKYILINEYYNPKPISVKYRGFKNKLFKRDFAGELLDKYPLKLLDYGFLYHRDNYFPRDDSNWFLFEKI